MNRETHERARQFLAAARVESIAAGERDWLDGHLAACRECSAEAQALDAAIASLRALHVAASPELARRASLAMRRHAGQLDAERARMAPLWIATAMSAVWMVLTMPYVWRGFAWFGRVAYIPDPMWQAGFVLWWFLPATMLAAVAAWRHKAEMNWGHR